VASEDAQILGLLVSTEASVHVTQLGFARVTSLKDSSKMLVDLQRERRRVHTRVVDMLATCPIGGVGVALAFGEFPDVIG